MEPFNHNDCLNNPFLDEKRYKAIYDNRYNDIDPDEAEAEAKFWEEVDYYHDLQQGN